MTKASIVRTSITAGALWVTIDRPEKRNALSRAVLAAMRDAFASHVDDESLRVAILTSAGEKSFAAGGDLRELNSIRTLDEAAQFAEESGEALDSMRRFPVPVIAALNGDALGGGAELCVACDMRIMAAHAHIGFIQGRLNLSTAWGGGPDLMRLLGYNRALMVLCRSERIAAAEAVGLGLADAVAPADERFEAFIQRFIEPMCRQSPIVMRSFKAQALAERLGQGRAERRGLEIYHFARSWVHEDHWAVADKLLVNSK